MPRLFLGNLGYDCRISDIERMFKNYGEIRNINIKGKFGFIEMDSRDDAEDAIHDLNNRPFNGGRIRIEFSNAYSTGGSGRRSRSRSRDEEGKKFSDGRYRKSDSRVIFSGLSSRTSWQDLKDYCSKCGEVLYSSVRRPVPGEGLVEFKTREGMENAIKELDDTKLDGVYVRVEQERSSDRRSRERSRRSRSRSYSRRRRSRSRSRRRSPSRGRRSDSRDKRSRSRSPVKRSRSPVKRSRSRS